MRVAGGGERGPHGSAGDPHRPVSGDPHGTWNGPPRDDRGVGREAGYGGKEGRQSMGVAMVTVQRNTAASPW